MHHGLYCEQYTSPYNCWQYQAGKFIERNNIKRAPTDFLSVGGILCLLQCNYGLTDRQAELVRLAPGPYK
jgi:hypothetical protein